MNPPGPIETKPKPKPITPADVREWFKGAVGRHPKLERANLDAATDEIRQIARLANLLRRRQYVHYGEKQARPWKRFFRDDLEQRKRFEVEHEVQKAIAVLKAKLPYLARTSYYDDNHLPDFQRLYKAVGVMEKRLGKHLRPAKIWHRWAKELRQPITDAWMKAGHKASATSEDSPVAEVLYESFPVIADDTSVQITHRAITDFFNEHRD